MNFSTGPEGYSYAATRWGRYSIRERWLDRRMPRLNEVAQFLDEDCRTFTTFLLRLMLLAETPAERDKLAEIFPREFHALRVWRDLSPLLPAEDAHGPTMRQLLTALNDEDAALEIDEADALEAGS